MDQESLYPLNIKILAKLYSHIHYYFSCKDLFIIKTSNHIIFVKTMTHFACEEMFEIQTKMTYEYRKVMAHNLS